MKYLFLAALLMLVTASFATYWSYPDRRSELPVIYWVTDPNPHARSRCGCSTTG